MYVPYNIWNMIKLKIIPLFFVFCNFSGGRDVVGARIREKK